MSAPARPSQIAAALGNDSVERITLCDAHGYGRQRGQTEMYRGVEYQATLLRKVMLEIAVNDDFLERTIETIRSVAKTGNDGNFGDGKIFVMPLAETIQIGGLQRGPAAI